MAQAFSISTDHIAAADRYAYWKEAVSNQLTGMSMDCGKDAQRRFWAKLSGARWAGAASLDIERAGVLVHRADPDIRRYPNDNMLIYLAPTTPSWFRAHGDREFVAEAGEIVVGYSDVPFSHAPVGGVDYRCKLMSLPLNLIGSFRREKRNALPRTIAGDRGIGALLRGHLEAFHANSAYLSAEAVEIAVRGLAQLAALAQGSVAADPESSRDAIAAGLISVAERYMARNFHRSELSPEIVAMHAGVSVRRLHALFEPSGNSFSRRLRDLRLAKARTLLTANPATSITEVAFCCGFDNLSTFYRVFKSAIGVTASEYRQALRERAAS